MSSVHNGRPLTIPATTHVATGGSGRGRDERRQVERVGEAEHAQLACGSSTLGPAILLVLAALRIGWIVDLAEALTALVSVAPTDDGVGPQGGRAERCP